MFARSRGAIDLDALLKAHGHVLLSRQPHQFFDPVAVRAFGNQQGIERAVCFQRFANRVDSGKAVHFERSFLFVVPAFRRHSLIKPLPRLTAGAT